MSNTNFRADGVASTTCWHCGRDKSKHTVIVVGTFVGKYGPGENRVARCPADKE